MFTDGAVAAGTAAYAVCSDTKVTVARLPDGTEVDDAELLAVESSLEMLYDTEPTPTVVFSDSLSTLQSIEQFKTKNNNGILGRLAKKYSSATKWHGQIILAWIPGHIGIAGNVKADNLAKSGLVLPTVAPTVTKCTVEQCKKEAASFINNKWQTHYNQNVCGLHYMALEPIVSRKSKYNDTNRRVERLTCRLSIGHALVNATLHRYNPKNSEQCSHCNVTEDLKHFISCPKSGIQQGVNETDILRNLKNKNLTEQLVRNVILLKREI